MSSITGAGLPLIVVGGDGMDPRLVERWMTAGHLPNLSRLSSDGVFARLHTTYPAESPVAWSTFITGLNPGEHGIFGFLHRDPHTYLPQPSMVSLGGTKATGHRVGTPFWVYAARAGLKASLVRVPVTFPPEAFSGTVVSGLGVPDLLMSWGTSSLYTDRPGRQDPRRIRLHWDEGTALTQVHGPEGSTVPLRIVRDRQGEHLLLDVGGMLVTLYPRDWSPWLPLIFMEGGREWQGICRFCLLSLEPHVGLYLSPIHLHPRHPVYPFTHPASLAEELVDALGLYPTLGWAEDASGLNTGFLDEEAFLQQAGYMMDEHERLTSWIWRRDTPQLLVSVTGMTDRIAHVFMNRSEDEKHSEALLQCYRRFDSFVGRLAAMAGPEATVLVLSDHGFAPVQQMVHLNAWLRDEGYLVQDENRSEPRRAFWSGVDWHRTRAYAVGLSHIYVNLRGRERLGIVAPGTEYARLCNEIAERLTRLTDPGTSHSVVSRVLLRDELYNGPHVDRSGDLVVAFRRGYRTSEQTAVGAIAKEVLVPNRRGSWTADHCSVDPDEVPGILLCNRPLRTEHARLLDIAPTVLHLLGVPVPDQMEGHSLVM